MREFAPFASSHWPADAVGSSSAIVSTSDGRQVSRWSGPPLQRTLYDQSGQPPTREIESEILEQSAVAWEHMLATPGLGGRAGAEIMAKRPRFRGPRLKQDVKSYARLLVESGIVLGVCDWGFCVYRKESSACLGNAIGPNPARREPSTCARCANFAVSSTASPLLGRAGTPARSAARRAGVTAADAAHRTRAHHRSARADSCHRYIEREEQAWRAHRPLIQPAGHPRSGCAMRWSA